MHTNYFKNDENDYYEDKFAVMLARSPVAGGDIATATNHVKVALAESLAGKPVSTAATRAYGCSVKYSSM